MARPPRDHARPHALMPTYRSARKQPNLLLSATCLLDAVIFHLLEARALFSEVRLPNAIATPCLP